MSFRRTMRDAFAAGVHRLALVLGLLATASCSDPVGPSAVPSAVYWLEWPAQVTNAAPGSMLVTIPSDPCSDHAYRFAVDAGSVRLVSEATPRIEPCPLAPSLPYDTVLALPSLPGPFDGFAAYYALQATLPDPVSGAVVRTAGTIAVGLQPDTTRHMAGAGILEMDSLGCPLLVPGLSFTRAYAVANMPPLGGQSRRALVGAHVVQAPKPAGCGSQRLVSLDYAVVALLP